MGLPGLLAAVLGASSVALTDYEPAVLQALQQNSALNRVQQRCAFHRLDFRDRTSIPPEWRGACRLVLAADLLYASLIAEPLVATLLELLHPAGQC